MYIYSWSAVTVHPAVVLVAAALVFRVVVLTRAGKYISATRVLS